MTDTLGPNCKRLMILKMSGDAIPAGGGLADGIEFFMNPDKRRAIMKDAALFVVDAIKVIRGAGDPNPWRNADDETVAGEILRRMEERRVGSK